MLPGTELGPCVVGRAVLISSHEILGKKEGCEMEMSDVLEFVKEYKMWFAVAAPFVIGFVVLKMMG